VYSESETSARVLNNTKHFRNGTKFYYERVPEERIEEFALTRKIDEDRNQRKINNRFPELSAAREAYLGKEPAIAKNRKRDVNSICEFSATVEMLA
jgi:hypothetical protein